MLTFSHIGITTRKLDDLIIFFQKYLGFEIVIIRESKTFPGKGYKLAFLKRDNFVLELLSSLSSNDLDTSFSEIADSEINSKSEEISRTAKRCYNSPKSHIAFETQNIEQLLKELGQSPLVKEFFVHRDTNNQITQALIEVNSEIVIEILQSN